MIRNRISAQNSRDKKKVYMQKLEAENQFVKEENSKLKQQLEQYLSENTLLKNKNTTLF